MGQRKDKKHGQKQICRGKVKNQVRRVSLKSLKDMGMIPGSNHNKINYSEQ